MFGHFLRWVLAILVGLCLSSPLPATEIKLFSVKELAAKWLADDRGIDASKELDGVLAEILTADKTMAAVGRFENAILQGRPLDADKNARHIALNFLKTSSMECVAIIPQKKDRPGPWIFTGSNGAVLSSGGHTSGIDFSATPRLNSLGWVRCDLKISADADQFEKTKGGLSTARLTLRAVMTVSRKGSSTDYRRELGQYRITADKDAALSELPPWNSK